MTSLSMLHQGGKHSNITHRFQPVLFDWWMKVRDRNVVWMNEVMVNAPENAGKEYYLPFFHRFALEGVLEALQVLVKHWNGEIGLESWTASTPSA